MSNPNKVMSVIDTQSGLQTVVDLDSVKDEGGSSLSKASGAEIVTGTDDAKYTTAKGLKDAGVGFVSPATNAQVGTTYTLLATDNGKIVKLTNAAAITVTVPAGLGAGFNCVCLQGGAGQVTFVADTATLTNRQSQLKIAGQWGVVSILAPMADALVLSGDTAT